MISLIEYRKRNPYNRLNADGISLTDWKESTRKQWIKESLDSAWFHNSEGEAEEAINIILDILQEMR